MVRRSARPPMLEVSDVIGAALGQISKAAIIDLYCQALACVCGESDTPPSFSDLLDSAEPTLLLRGDRVPQEWRKKAMEEGE